MARHHLLDLVGIDVEAGDEDHVLLAVDDLDETVLVHEAHVARLEEAVGGEDIGGLFGPVPVAGHHLGTANADLADLVEPKILAILVADGDFGRRDRQADRAGERIAVEAVRRRHRRRFRQAVTFGDHDPGQVPPALGDAALHGHAAAERQQQRLEVDLLEVIVVQQRVEQRVEAGKDVDGVCVEFLDQRGNVARVGDQDVFGTLLHAHNRVHRQRVDVIERQRAQIDRAFRPRLFRIGAFDPDRVLRDIGQDVAVQQRRALGDAGRAAGILQEGDVVRALFDRLQPGSRAGGERVVEGKVAWQGPGRNHLLHVPHDQIDDQPLEAEQVAHRGDHDMLDLGARDHRLQRGGEILQDHDRFGAGIVELVFQFARRVERVDVDHRETGAQRAHHGERILQHVRHHDGDARAFFEALGLQEGAEFGRLPLDLRIGQRFAHAGEGRPVGICLAGVGKQGADRGGGQGADLGRHAFRIAFQPRARGGRCLVRVGLGHCHLPRADERISPPAHLRRHCRSACPPMQSPRHI